MKNLESKLFLLIAFFIGTWGALFHAMQTGLIALGLIYNIVKYKDDFVMNIKKYKYYVAIPVIYILYSAVHTLIIVTSGKYAGLKPGFGIFEKEFLVFLFAAPYSSFSSVLVIPDRLSILSEERRIKAVS